MKSTPIETAPEIAGGAVTGVEFRSAAWIVGASGGGTDVKVEIAHNATVVGWPHG